MRRKEQSNFVDDHKKDTCQKIDVVVEKLAGSMACSKNLLMREVWLCTLLIVFRFVATATTTGVGFGSSALIGLSVLYGALLIVYFFFVFFLDLHRAVGDAVGDLAYRMTAENLMRLCHLVLRHPKALYEKFTEATNVKSLCWVMVDTPINTSAVYKATGGFLFAVALTFLHVLFG